MNVEGRVFFKVLSSRSFFKGKRLLVLKYNMADKTSVHSPHENVFKQTLSPRSFYVFRKGRQCKFIFLLSPSLDPINIISVRALEAVKVSGETLQRSRRTSPAVGSYLQPWEGSGICVVNYNFFAWVLSNIHSVHLWAWRVFRTSCIFYLSHCHVLQNCTCEILLARRLRACLLMRSLFQTFSH